MKRVENFRYVDVVLYTKGWYEASDSLFKDLEKYIKLNDEYVYQKEVFSIQVIASHMLNALDIILSNFTEEERKNHYLGTHRRLFNYVNDRARFYNTDYNTSLIYVIYAFLQGLERNQIRLPKPVYKRGRPRIGWPCKRGMTYKEMNKIASRFNWD